MSPPCLVYDPFSEFDRLFEDAFNARVGKTQGNPAERNGTTRVLKPRMDVHEDSQNNTVLATFELPGLKKEDVTIDVHDNLLSISGESKISSEHNENGYAVRERRFGKFSRSIPLPQGVKTEDVKASLENGVLSITFPKTTPEQTPKRITID